MAELDRFIKMIPGFAKKIVHVDLNALGKAYMSENSAVTQNRKGTDDSVKAAAKSPHIGDIPSGGGGSSGESG